MNKIRLLIPHLIAFLPLNCLRVLCYKLLGYKIGKKVKIGMGTILISDNCLIENFVKIGRNNFVKTKDFKIGTNARIGPNNKLIGWASYSANSDIDVNYIHIGKECLITEGHLLDGSFGMSVGNYSWIAGRNSSFWSHGSTQKQGPIIIGEKCYIGSDVKIGTNVIIGNEVLVSMGSIVLKGCPDRCTIAGSPATVKRENYVWHKHWDCIK